MLMRSKQIDGLDRANDRVQSASAATAGLISSVIASACKRLPILDQAGKAAHFHSLIEAGAWTDAVLAVLEIELPQWRLRRLVLEDGEWVCSLSKQVYLPVGLDDSVEATHADLPLAILAALLEGRSRENAEGACAPKTPRVPLPRTAESADRVLSVISHDNFG